MKTLYLIGGTMGVGKTCVCQLLKKSLTSSVFLDGDWCWDANPFRVTDETKAMVMDNICHLLKNFLRCSAYEHVIFCWVMHEQAIINEILARVDTSNCRLKVLSLVCGEAALKERLAKDVARGVRTPDIIERSLARLPLYERLDTVKIDTTGKTPEEVVSEILAV